MASKSKLCRHRHKEAVRNLGHKPKMTRAAATIKIHFGVTKAEAGGYRAEVERQGRLIRGSRRIRTLDTKWCQTQTEAQKALNKMRRRWLGRL